MNHERRKLFREFNHSIARHASTKTSECRSGRRELANKMTKARSSPTFNASVGSRTQPPVANSQ